MLTEDYCDFETAKLLKEKRFCEPCYRYYGTDGIITIAKGFKHFNQSFITTFSAPTLQMACKWLRKKHNVFISPVFIDESYEGAEKVEPYYGFTVEDVSTKKFLATSKSTHYDEPEEACEAAIKYCLENLI